MSKRNTLLVLTVFVAFGFLMATTNVRAHEASMVELWYEVGDEPESLDPTVPQRLTVIITHDVTNEHIHYIENVNVTIWTHNVTLNYDPHYEEHPDQLHAFDHINTSDPGIQVINANYTEQHDYSMFEYNYDNISDIYVSKGGNPINDDVIIRVTVTCNLGGEFHNEIDLVHPYIHHDTDFTTAILPSIVIAVLLSIPMVGVVIVDNVQKKKNKM